MSKKQSHSLKSAINYKYTFKFLSCASESLQYEKERVIPLHARLRKKIYLRFVQCRERDCIKMYFLRIDWFPQLIC